MISHFQVTGHFETFTKDTSMTLNTKVKRYTVGLVYVLLVSPILNLTFVLLYDQSEVAGHLETYALTDP